PVLESPQAAWTYWLSAVMKEKSSSPPPVPYSSIPRMLPASGGHVERRRSASEGDLVSNRPLELEPAVLRGRAIYRGRDTRSRNSRGASPVARRNAWAKAEEVENPSVWAIALTVWSATSIRLACSIWLCAT